MDSCSNDFCPSSDWQATSVSLLMNLRNALLSIPEDSLKTYPQAPKQLTRGAVFMVCVISAFILLAVAGSAFTIHEFFQNIWDRKEKPHRSYKGFSRRRLMEASKISTNSDAWLNRLKSFLGCFCIFKNGKKLLSISSKKDEFKCIHGIRSLSNFWIIILHICMGCMSSMRNVGDLHSMVQTWSSQLVLNGQYAVDAFFVLGGFLNAYLFFVNYDKNNGNVSWTHFYLKRFIRLTPVYMVVLGFYMFLFSYTGSGLIWPTFDTNPVCRQSWWWNLLYINNFRNHANQCLEWCWYLAADMQFYIISPIFLVSFMRHPKFGYVLTGACIASSSIASFIITKQYNLVDGFSRMEYNFADMNAFYGRYWMYFDLVYVRPYTRISSYLVAVLLAHYLYTRKLKIKCSQSALLLGWISTVILWFYAYFALFKREESIIENAIYNGTKHLFYSIGLSWIIFTCLTRQAGFINKFLSWKIFSPLTKLSYCAYLIHPIVLMRYYQTAEYLEDLSVSSVLSLSAYIYFWTYIFSFIASLLIEHPFLNLLELISTKKRPARLVYASSEKKTL